MYPFPTIKGNVLKSILKATKINYGSSLASLLNGDHVSHCRNHAFYTSENLSPHYAKIPAKTWIIGKIERFCRSSFRNWVVLFKHQRNFHIWHYYDVAAFFNGAFLYAKR